MRRLLKEPLLRFLVAGALIFALSAVVRDESAPDDRRVVVTPERIRQLEEGWAKQWRRRPTPPELDGMIDEYVREEILYREGLALGLDRDDTIVRRRVAQKVRFMVEDLVAPREPAPAELEAFFERNPDLFRRPARLSFGHVYFSTHRRGAAAGDDARRALRSMEADDAGPGALHGGDPFMLRDHYGAVTRREVSGQFGDAFAESVFSLEPGAWHGPIASSYGVHLVRVTERTDETLPAFDEVREEVRQVWLADRRRVENDEAMRRLRERYEVVVESASTGAGSTSKDLAAARSGGPQ